MDDAVKKIRRLPPIFYKGDKIEVFQNKLWEKATFERYTYQNDRDNNAMVVFDSDKKKKKKKKKVDSRMIRFRELQDGKSPDEKTAGEDVDAGLSPAQRKW